MADWTWVAGVPWLGTLCVLVVTYLACNATYSLYLSPLSQYPGPTLWAISKIPSQLSVLRGHTHLHITALHERYGPVVRIGPNELAFNTPQAFRDIYGSPVTSKSFKKDRSHYLPPANGVDHIASAVDDSVHARHRRLLAYAFSDRALRGQEGLVTGYVDTLIRKLKSIVHDNRDGMVDIKSWFNYTTFDITGDLMFGESFQCLEDSQLHPWIALVFNSIKAFALMGVATQFPWFNSILQSLIPKSIKQQELDHFKLGAEKVDRRLKMGTARPDFTSAVLKNGFSDTNGEYQDNEKILSRAEMHSNAFILIIAGSETSATLLSGCIYYLCQSPKILRTLVHEIRTAFGTDGDIIFASTAKLPYLAAVIEESLRMYPPFVTSLARVPPAGGGMVDGHYVPEDTIVACHHYASYHSTSNFALPDEFIPERWLGTDARFASDKKDVLQPFSLGPRNCLGKGLAYAEIRLILCKLLFHFDVALSAESARWADQEVYFLWDKPALMVKLTKRVLD